MRMSRAPLSPAAPSSQRDWPPAARPPPPPLLGTGGARADNSRSSSLRRIAVTCAYRLRAAGLPVRVMEGQSRTGGRMYSLRNHFADGQVCELGGELIDTGHTHIRALAGELNIGSTTRQTTPRRHGLVCGRRSAY
jgi:hypothetical protein